MPRSKTLVSYLAILSLAWIACTPGNASAAEQLKIYLVRHAEKVDQSRESALTPLGTSRANKLAELLRYELLTQVFSTPFNRTLLTAKPVAEHHGLTIQKYDAGKLAQFANKLLGMRGIALVVGHSDTTPVLVSHLLGTDFPMLEDHVYDRVYVVTLGEDGTTSLDMLYTEPRTPASESELSDTERNEAARRMLLDRQN